MKSKTETIIGLEARLEYWKRMAARFAEDRKPSGNWMLLRGNQKAPRKAQEFIREKKRQERKALYRCKQILRKLNELEAA